MNRPDLTAEPPAWIQSAEAELRRDERVRQLQDHGTFSITGDGIALPADLDYVESWYLDGPLFYGEIEVVGAEALAHRKALFGTSGVPRFAAIVAGTVRFAPSPDGTYDSTLTYWRSLPALSTGADTNWLLLAHPDIYEYAALVEAASFLKDDQRIAVWRSELERRLESLHARTSRSQFSGTMRRRPRRPIG